MKTRNTNYLVNAASAVGLILGLVILANTTSAQDISSRDSDSARECTEPFFPPYSKPFHKSFRKWSAEWWQFIWSIPTSVNPILDLTGQFCAVGQHGPVWFLAGSFDITPVMRTCSIPEGKALFFPVINRVDINVTHQTAEELRAEIAPCIDAVTALSAEVDDESIGKLERFRVKSIPFEITVPPDGLFGLSAKTYSPVVSDGFYLMLKPLSVGKHRIHFAANEAAVGKTCAALSQDITYILDVVPVELGRGDANREKD